MEKWHLPHFHFDNVELFPLWIFISIFKIEMNANSYSCLYCWWLEFKCIVDWRLGFINKLNNTNHLAPKVSWAFSCRDHTSSLVPSSYSLLLNDISELKGLLKNANDDRRRKKFKRRIKMNETGREKASVTFPFYRHISDLEFFYSWIRVQGIHFPLILLTSDPVVYIRSGLSPYWTVIPVSAAIFLFGVLGGVCFVTVLS